MGVDGEAESAAELQPDRYYLLSDAGSSPAPASLPYSRLPFEQHVFTITTTVS